MGDNFDITSCNSSRSISENTKYTLKLKYGGYFRLARNSSRKIYCFGFRKLIYLDTCSYNLNHLVEEVTKHYPSQRDRVFSILYVDKHAKEQSFIELDSDENFMMMLRMYEIEKEVTIYVTTDNHLHESGQYKVIDDPDGENDSDSNCPSEDSYHSRHSTDSEEEMHSESHDQSFSKKNQIMKIASRFSNVIAFRRALNHYAITNEFEYHIEKSDLTRFSACCEDRTCKWRIHASRMEDEVTFEVRKFVEIHSCIRSNKCGNKHATKGWIADVITDKLKSDGEISPAEVKKWLLSTYNVDVPYMRAFRGKEQAYIDVYGKWEDSFIKMNDFKHELLNKNPRSIVDIEYEMKGDNKHFQRFFISLTACSKGFLAGCRPYIGIDACHLKGKFNGVLAAATSIDGNNGLFPVAYGVLEAENTNSWTWFLEQLKKAIGQPNGLVISSDMQKGLGVAMAHVYPNVEHRECMRHLYSNFKKQFRGDFFRVKLWGAANTYSVSLHDRLLKEIASVREEEITFLNENHNKVWSRSKFGTTAKCHYITNNISECFNSWIGEARYKPVLDLLDAIREKLMMRFNKRREIAKKWKGVLVPKTRKYLNIINKNLTGHEVSRSSENRAEVKFKGRRWGVILDEKKCSCGVWQVTGLPCVHVASFISSTRDTNWEQYVDPYFTVDKFKEAYALEISPIPDKDQWVHIETMDKVYPPTIKRPPGRPKKNRIVPPGEPRRKHKCARCGNYGHHQKTCKNLAPAAVSASEGSNPPQASTSKRGRGKRNTSTRESKKARSRQLSQDELGNFLEEGSNL